MYGLRFARVNSDAYRQQISEGIHLALVEALHISPLDRFQIISEHDNNGLIYDPHYLDIERTDDIVIIQITLNVGRTTEMKKALYASIVKHLEAQPGIRPQNVFIQLTEIAKDNTSLGNGEAQFAV